MANYKKGFKPKKEDRFISYMLIGFAAVFFVIILSIILYNVFAQPLDYERFDRIEDYSLITQMPEDEYLVYYYSPECYYCKEIKMDLLNFADENDADIKVYFLDQYNVTGTNNVPGMDGTPTIITIRNGQLVDLSPGATGILNVFNEINNGTYIYID